eukprot:1828860-Prymnesium_polylepis.1
MYTSMYTSSDELVVCRHPVERPLIPLYIFLKPLDRSHREHFRLQNPAEGKSNTPNFVGLTRSESTCHFCLARQGAARGAWEDGSASRDGSADTKQRRELYLNDVMKSVLGGQCEISGLPDSP